MKLLFFTEPVNRYCILKEKECVVAYEELFSGEGKLIRLVPALVRAEQVIAEACRNRTKIFFHAIHCLADIKISTTFAAQFWDRNIF